MSNSSQPTVTGDPATATYVPASAPGTEPTAPTPTPAPTPTDTPANGAVPPADVATEPVPGQAGYFSPRDVDGDGLVDVIHAVSEEGISQIAHVDTDGNVTLLEEDRDGNDTYETALRPDADGSVRVATDTDDDGYVNQAAYLNADGDLTRTEVIEDGAVVEALIDTDGDGSPDVAMYDTDQNGQADTVVRDTDGDSVTNDMLVDTDGDSTLR